MENYHSHTEFCDGRASMAEMAKAAFDKGFGGWGFSPHSPICCQSGANMKSKDVEPFIEEAKRLKKAYESRMKILIGMEIDYVGKEYGPHIQFFKDIPLDYRIGSVHFVRNQKSVPIDVDGPSERFLSYLEEEFAGDLRYVVETYFEMEIEMLDEGGFDIIGHIDKIGDNGSYARKDLEDQEWYANLIEKVIKKATEKGVIIEINTKKYYSGGRFFPAERWWPLLKKYKAKLILSSDAHYPDKTDMGYEAAMEKLMASGISSQLISLL